MTSEARSLHIREWLAVMIVIIVFGVIITLSSRNTPTDPADLEKAGFVWVDVEGCVKYPGSYQLIVGSTVQDALKVAEALPDCSYKGLRRNAKLKNGQMLFVKEQPKITIYLEGAVRTTGALQVRKGTRLIDLLAEAPLKRNADTNFLKRKRRLKAGETITIPEKCSSL